MMIDFAVFTPFASLIGGVMIGTAAFLLLLMHGRVLGVSGILGGIIPFLNQKSGRDERSWRWFFLAGVVLGPIIVIYGFSRPVEILPAASGLALPIAGFLVGIGTAIGSGCTSGHGICGLARLSVRSMTAVGVFMLTGVITVFLIRHIF
ncbi:MAG: YeeE/YedE family protein [Bacteroidetes bacterium]|nr:YeeE/YedE family protein [Bacteroidota bacterium]